MQAQRNIGVPPGGRVRIIEEAKTNDTVLETSKKFSIADVFRGCHLLNKLKSLHRDKKQES